MTKPNPIETTTGWASPFHIVNHPTLPLTEKRALLASWASDARAVPNYPSVRRLDDGRLVHIDDVLDALKLLDSFEAPPANVNQAKRRSVRPAHWSRLGRIWRRRRNDDDDDPPPAIAADLPTAPVVDGGLAVASLPA